MAWVFPEVTRTIVVAFHEISDLAKPASQELSFKQPVFKRAAAEINRLGGKLLFSEDDVPIEFEDLYGAPFTSGLGIDYEKRHVYLWVESELGAIPHEAAHIFASRKNPDTMWSGLEDVFIGWEYLFSKRVGCVRAWHDWCCSVGRTVGIRNSILFSEQTLQAQKAIIAEQVQMARKLGLIRDQIPVSVRT